MANRKPLVLNTGQQEQLQTGDVLFDGTNAYLTGATGAPIGASYVTVLAEAALVGSRQLAVGVSLTLTDGGAGSTATLGTIQDIRTTASPTFNGLTLTNPLGIGQGGTAASTAATALTNLGVKRAIKTLDQTVTNSATPVADTDLTFTVAANETWLFRAFLSVNDTSNGTANYKMNFSGPAGSTIVWGGIARIIGGTTAFPISTKAGAVSGSCGGSSTDTTLMLEGSIINGATPGSLTYNFCQNTQTAAQSVINRAGSYLVAERV